MNKATVFVFTILLVLSACGKKGDLMPPDAPDSTRIAPVQIAPVQIAPVQAS